LPPVFGPLTTSARRRRGRGRSARPSGSSSGAARRAADLVADLDRRAAPAPRQRPRASARSTRPRLDERASAAPLAHERRQLAQDPLDLLALARCRLASRLFSSTTANGSTKSVWPELERRGRSRHLAARARAHGEHGPAAALGDERLLQGVADRSERATRASSSATACARCAARAQPAQLARRVVAQVGAVLLDAARRSPSRARRGRVDRRDDVVQQRSVSAARRARAPARPTVTATRDGAQVGRAEHAVARRVSAASRTSAMPPRDGSAEASRSAIPSAVSAAGARPRRASGDGTSARASDSP
jgi:hypothetical protein